METFWTIFFKYKGNSNSDILKCILVVGKITCVGILTALVYAILAQLVLIWYNQTKPNQGLML